MNQVRRVVRRAAWRLWAVDLAATLAVTTTAVLAMLLVARVVERVLGLTSQFAPWWRWAWIAGAGLAVLSAILWTTIRRRRNIAVAVELDERAGLSEALSTALYVHASEDPWARSMVETAESRAKTLNVRQAIPFTPPPLWPVPVAVGAALALVWWLLPNFDLLGRAAAQVAQQQRQEQVVQVRAEVQDKEKILQNLLSKAKVEFKEEKTTSHGLDAAAALNDPAAIRRAAVKKLTEVTNKLELEKSGDRAAKADAIKDAMRQLKQPGDGPLDEFSKDLAKGDFEKAGQQLAKLSAQMNDGKMTPQQKAVAKEQMESLAKQFEGLANDQKQLEKKLEQKGLDKKTAQELAKLAAKSPEELAKAMEKMKNLTPAQKQELLKLAKAAMECQGACQNMSKAMSQAAKGMSEGGNAAMAALADELSDAEMLAADMQNLDSALSEAKKQLKSMGEALSECENPSKDGDGSKASRSARGNGGGRGGDQAGNSDPAGPRPDGPVSDPDDFRSVTKKAAMQSNGGPVIGTRVVTGPQVRGESVAEFAAAVEAGEQEAMEGMDQNQIPREMQDAVKHYFGTLGAKAKATPVVDPEPKAPAAPAPAPTSPK